MILLKDTKQKIVGTGDAIKVFRDLLMLEDAIDQEKEHFYVMHLDTRSRIKLVECVSIGIVNAGLVHPREVFRRAIAEGSFSILAAHNHPSGEVDPSNEDCESTSNLQKGGQILGIQLLDHLVFSKDKVYSFAAGMEM